MQRNPIIPDVGDRTVTIPLTFDSRYRSKALTKGRLVSVVIIFLIWIILAITSIFVFEFPNKIRIPIFLFIFLFYISRKLVIRENYYRKKREELLDNNYQYEYALFWQIYSIRKAYPYICYYTNGLKAVFVRFEKDIIVGKDQQDEFRHFEAISEAYNMMQKKGVNAIHIDYMDMVGKDTRMEKLFESATNIENKDIQNIITRMYTNIETDMKNAFASYDVYVFLYKGRDEAFLDALEEIIPAFNRANFIRYKILNNLEMADLARTLMNIDTFSVQRASSKLFQGTNESDFLNVIWVVRDGNRIVLNKTKAEREEEARVINLERETQKQAKKKRKKQSRRLRRLVDIKNSEELDLFGDGTDQDYYDGYDDEYYNDGNYYQEEYSAENNQYDTGYEPETQLPEYEEENQNDVYEDYPEQEINHNPPQEDYAEEDSDEEDIFSYLDDEILINDEKLDTKTKKEDKEQDKDEVLDLFD
jgi:hypothetical protein